jgi:NapH/MauN family ferredoxin-type protein
MPAVRTRYIRYGIATIILGLTTYLALGFGARSFEDFCPFGGAESLWGLVKYGEFSCALGPLNLSLMLVLIGLVILTKKSFCGWACPIGFLSELSARLSGRLWKNRPRLPRKTNGLLKFIRYAVLVVALIYTYRLGELVLRGYDPFYLIFSGFGHGSAGVISMIVLAVLVVGVFVLPMFFCRYLCPLGAVFDPFSRLGIIKIYRDESKCTSCGNCTSACPHDIQVETYRVVRQRDCTNCLECIEACPEKGTLELKAGL